MNKKITVFEHQVLKVDSNEEFTAAHFKALEKYGIKTNEKYFSVGNNRIKFSNYVGVIQVNNLTIEILPKADISNNDSESKEKWHNALLEILNECKLIKLDSITYAKLKLKSASILDLYYDLFLTETETIVRHGFIKAYRKNSGNLNKLKGKIKFNEHIKKNYIHKEKFYVEHDVYDVDNKLNRILLKALLVLTKISNNPLFNNRIQKLLLDFENVSEVNITDSTFSNLVFNRCNERYRQAIKIAQLIILRFSPDLKGGNENVLAIMFDMNVLYETYIYRKLKSIEGRHAIQEVRRQVRQPFWDKQNIKADIIIRSKSGKCVVIDTKWKVLNNNRPSDDDLKQMFVYNLHYESNLSILLYPKAPFNQLNKKPFEHSDFGDKYCQISFADLFDDQNKLCKELGDKLYKDLEINLQ